MELVKYERTARTRRKNSKGTSKTHVKKKDKSETNVHAERNRLPTPGFHAVNAIPKQFVLTSYNDDAVKDFELDLSEHGVPNWSRDPSRDNKERQRLGKEPEVVPDWSREPSHGSRERRQLNKEFEVVSDWTKDSARGGRQRRRLHKELEAFSDMDYMVPDHLEELLRQEGVSDHAVDNTVALGKMLNDRAAYLNHIYHIRRRKHLARRTPSSNLPPIDKGNSHSRSQRKHPDASPRASGVESRRDRREKRERPWAERVSLAHSMFPAVPTTPLVSSTNRTPVSEAESEPSGPERGWTLFFRSDAERRQWKSERKEELSNTPSDFVHPRVVLISSNVSRCNSMSKAIRRGDSHILYLVYDFAEWTPQDISAAVRTELDKYSPGCKAKSLLLICQGGVGCIYLLKKIVLTPQKLRRTQYQHVREFWSALGGMMSKAEPEKTVIDILGASLDNSQGKQLLKEIGMAVLPNQVQLHPVDEETGSGREAIAQYFDYRKFLLWRAKTYSRRSLDYTDITRSWSSLAESADDMEVD